MEDDNILEGDMAAEPDLGRVAIQSERSELKNGFPFVFKWLTKEDILTTRLVCHEIRNLTDYILKNGGRITQYDNVGLFPGLVAPFPSASERKGSFEWTHLRPNREWPHVWISSQTRIDVFEAFLLRQRVTESGKFIRPRIVGNKVGFREETSPEKSLAGAADRFQSQFVFLKRAVQFLRVCKYDGLQITVRIAEETPRLTLLGLLEDITQAIPNLLSLDLLPISWGILQFVEGEERIRRYLDEKGPLTLSNLSRLSIMLDIKRPIVSFLSESLGNQLNYLEFSLEDEWLHIVRPETLFVYPFLALKELKITTASSSLPFFLSIKAPALKVMSFIQKPETDVERETIPFVELIEAVNNFQNLSSLNLLFTWSIVDEFDLELIEWNASFSRHAALKNLKISTYSQIPPLRFFTNWFPSLAFISLEDELPDLAEERVDEDLSLFERGEAAGSQIWEAAPQLEKITLKRWDLHTGESHLVSFSRSHV